jgi:hypothetical protein
MERNPIAVAWNNIFMVKHSLRISGDKHIAFYLDKTWVS